MKMVNYGKLNPGMNMEKSRFMSMIRKGDLCMRESGRKNIHFEKTIILYPIT
jgi:hypothetical protein